MLCVDFIVLAKHLCNNNFAAKVISKAILSSSKLATFASKKLVSGRCFISSHLSFIRNPDFLFSATKTSNILYIAHNRHTDTYKSQSFLSAFNGDTLNVLKITSSSWVMIFVLRGSVSVALTQSGYFFWTSVELSFKYEFAKSLKEPYNTNH